MRMRRALGMPLALSAVLAFVIVAPGPAHAALPDRAQAWTVMTPAGKQAARTDRRPVAGGLYDAVAGKTFISWGGVHEDNYVQAYDHRTGTWSAPVRVGDGADDSHNYRTLVPAPAGHLLAFHNLHHRQLYVSRPPDPHSILATWT